MPGRFELPSPLTISEADDEVTITPLVAITEKRTWAETDLQSAQPEFNAANASDQFVVGAVAERGGTRVAVFTGSHGPGMQVRNWASDRATNTGPFGEGTAERFG